MFRRETAPNIFTIKLPNVNSDVRYELTFSDEDLKHSTIETDGDKLISGLDVKIEKAPGSLLIFYKRK